VTSRAEDNTGSLNICFLVDRTFTLAVVVVVVVVAAAVVVA
jgi:hypothetical protein